MAEKRTEVRTIMVRLMCDKCGEGEMKPTGIALMSHPPQYPHKCDKCGAETTIRGGKAYPRIEYEEVTPNAPELRPTPKAVEPLQKRCRWFVKRGATTWFNRGFRSKEDASNWIDAHGSALDWRCGFLFRLRGEPIDIEIVDRMGNRAST